MSGNVVVLACVRVCEAKCMCMCMRWLYSPVHFHCTHFYCVIYTRYMKDPVMVDLTSDRSAVPPNIQHQAIAVRKDMPHVVADLLITHNPKRAIIFTTTKSKGHPSQPPHPHSPPTHTHTHSHMHTRTLMHAHFTYFSFLLQSTLMSSQTGSINSELNPRP